MTETWCALLNVLILTIVAGANGVIINKVRHVEHDMSRLPRRSDDVGLGQDDG